MSASDESAHRCWRRPSAAAAGCAHDAPISPSAIGRRCPTAVLLARRARSATTTCSPASWSISVPVDALVPWSRANSSVHRRLERAGQRPGGCRRGPRSAGDPSSRLSSFGGGGLAPVVDPTCRIVADAQAAWPAEPASVRRDAETCSSSGSRPPRCPGTADELVLVPRTTTQMGTSAGPRGSTTTSADVGAEPIVRRLAGSTLSTATSSVNRTWARARPASAAGSTPRSPMRGSGGRARNRLGADPAGASGRPDAERSPASASSSEQRPG